MRFVNDASLDELRNSDGWLFSQVPSQDWLRPNGVTLHGNAMFIPPRNHKAPINALRFRRDPELEFVIQKPWTLRRPGGQCVRPTADLFERFLLLSDASDEQIRDFASRFGPLFIYYRSVSRSVHTERDEIAVSESCSVWRYFARCMRALLHIAARVRLSQSADKDDWRAIGSSPPRISDYEELPENAENTLDFLNPLILRAEADWHYRAGFIHQGGNLGNRPLERSLESRARPCGCAMPFP